MRLLHALILTCLLAPNALCAGQTDYVLCSDPASEKAHRMTESGSKIERCGGNVGLRSEFYLCRTTPVIVPEPKNLALNLRKEGYPRPSASTTSPGYDVWGPLDGGDGTWTNVHTDEKESTWDLDFGKPTTIGKVMVKTWASYPLSDFDLLFWDDKAGGWHTNPLASVRGNKGPLITLPGLSVTTSKLRMRCINGPKHQAIYRRIQEFEVYAPPAPVPAFTPREISYEMKAPTSGTWTLEVQEVNDERRNGDRTLYRVLVDGKSVHLRDFVDDGPGLMTYFVDVPATGKPTARVTLRDTSGYGMRIRSLRVYDDFETYCEQNRFMLPMLICPRYTRFDAAKHSEEIDRWIKVFEQAGARDCIGFAVDFAYLQKGPAAMRDLAESLGKLVLAKNVPFVPGFPTTWSFTPLHTPDGNGKTFGAIEYQQIAWSEFDNYHDPGLKEYMDSCKPGWYDVRYGLTTPNHWSNTPWLTMNNPRLNDARTKGIANAIEELNPWLLKMEQAGMGGNLIGMIGEDEPVYWTKIVDVFEDGYGRVNNGVPRIDMLVDFNWGVICDAAKDGVTLDPSDGLDDREKMWLHLNPAKFNRMLSRTMRESIRKEAIVVEGDRIEFPKDDRGASNYVYWVGGKGYPLDDRFHPIWEQAVYPEAGVGLGGNPKDYLRARELGRVACSDYESHRDNNAYRFIPNLCGMYENGCRFSHHTNQGEPESWAPIARMLARPTPEMRRKRMESLLITWRRDAINLIEELRPLVENAENTPTDPGRSPRPATESPEIGRPSPPSEGDGSGLRGRQRTLLANARRLLDEGRYRDAYEEALKAKSIALPANYRVKGSGALRPHDVTITGASVEATIRGVGKDFAIDTRSAEAFTLTARGLPPGAEFLLYDPFPAFDTRTTVRVDSTGTLRVQVPAGSYTLEVRQPVP